MGGSFFFAPLVQGLGSGCGGVCLSLAGLCGAFAGWVSSVVAWGPWCVCWGSMIRETSFPDIQRIRVNDPLA